MKLLFVASLEDEPLPFVESRETPFDADADVNCRISNDKSRSVYQSSASVPVHGRHPCQVRLAETARTRPEKQHNA